MAQIKDIFDKAEDGQLTLEQFESIAKEMGMKIADLSEGKYVSKSKYETDLKTQTTLLETANGQIADLNSTIATRDEDLTALQAKLEIAGQDASALEELKGQLSGLQSKYDADVQTYQAKMQQQSYEFAVREFANTKNFTSQAAKRDFVKLMIDKNLQMEDGKILGREDFAEKYAEENSDAFVVAAPEPVIPDPEPEPTPAPIPEFVAPTPGPTPQNDDAFDFGFTGVRARS